MPNPPTPDNRPTIDFGTRYVASKSEAAKAAKQVQAGQARNNADERAASAKKRKRNQDKYRAALGPSPSTRTEGTSVDQRWKKSPTSTTYRKSQE